MKIEDKKILAEWMGWEWNDFAMPTIDRHTMGAHILSYNWNPDTNHEHFKEVIETFEHTSLTDSQMSRLDSAFGELTYSSEGKPLLETYLWISDNMPKVLEAVLTVIKK